MEKRPVLSRWAIGCFPIDGITSTSEDGEVICNVKKSQAYRRAVQLPESKSSSCPFLKGGGAEDWAWDRNNEICQRRKSSLSRSG